jgi:hypothetical protein
MSPLLSTAMDLEDFSCFLTPNPIQKSLSTLKTQRIRRETTVKTVNSILTKRAFDFEFKETEESSLKILKPTKTTQNNTFKAGQNSNQKSISKIDI